MRLLLLTQYFPPETGAPQNRLFQLARRMHEAGFCVEVLTAMPNYPVMQVYEGYRGLWYRKETMGGFTLHRSWIYAVPARAVLPRLLNYFSFVFSSLFTGLFRVAKPDLILCESPPLFLGMTAWLLAVCRGAKLIFNVSDLWPESAERLGIIRNRLLLGAASGLEAFLYRRSWMVSGQTMGIVQDINRRFPGREVFWLRNGVDLAEIDAIDPDPGWREREGFGQDDFLVIYAGIIGHAQGLETILEAAAILRDRSRIRFILMGSGPVREELIALQCRMALQSVVFIPNRPRTGVIRAIRACDAAVVPLRKLDLFRGAIPSKIFENLALEKPLLLGVDGEARELVIDRGQAGLFFEPGDAGDLAEKVLMLEGDPDLAGRMGANGRAFVAAGFSSSAIAQEFIRIIEKKYDPKRHS